MMMLSRPFRVRILLLFLLIYPAVWLFPDLPALEVSVGFADRFHSGYFTPVSVVVRNPDGNLSGDLILEYISGTALQKGAGYSVRQPVTLSGGLPGVFRFTMPLEVSSYPLSVRLERRGVLLAEGTADLRPMNAEGPLVAGLSRRPSLDSLIPPLSEHFGRQVELSYPRSEFLPVDPLGWEGVSLVIWHDFPPELADPRSLRALALWVEAGGELIIIAGPWLAGKTFPGSFLPYEVAGAVQVDGLTMYPLSGMESPEDEQILDRHVGKGRIRYIPWDAVHRDLPSAERNRVWMQIIQKNHQDGAVPVEDLAAMVTEAPLRSDESLMPPIGGALLIPVVFFLASGGILIAGRRGSGLKFRTIQLSILAVLAAGSAAAVFFRYYPTRPEVIVRQLDLLITGNTGAMRRIRHLSFISPENRLMDYSLPSDGVLRYSREAGLNLVLENGNAVLMDLELPAWKAVDVSVVSTEAGTGTGAAVPGGSPEERVYRNNSGDTWYDPVLTGRGTVVPLGRLWKPGEVLIPPAVFPQEAVAGTTQETPEPAGLPEYMAGVLDGNRNLIIARGADSTVIVHTGGAP